MVAQAAVLFTVRTAQSCVINYTVSYYWGEKIKKAPLVVRTVVRSSTYCSTYVR